MYIMLNVRYINYYVYFVQHSKFMYMYIVHTCMYIGIYITEYACARHLVCPLPIKLTATGGVYIR